MPAWTPPGPPSARPTLIVAAPPTPAPKPKPHAIAFSNPDFAHLGRHIASAAARRLAIARKGMHAGAPGALIVALGPSVAKPGGLCAVRHYARLGWTIFALKEAVGWLRNRGLPVHYAANMDPGVGEAARTPVWPGVTYCLASSCHPVLFDHVIEHGGKALVYHSACGYTERQTRPGFALDLGNGSEAVVLGNWELSTTSGLAASPIVTGKTSEIEVYQRWFDHGDVVIGGFTVANRALGLAKYMGFERVVMVGADFGWRVGNGDTYYAGFVKAKPIDDVWMMDHGKVDGTDWKTRPDLLASAIDVARHIKRGHVKVLGDSLAVALSKHPDEYLDRVVKVNA